MLRALNIVVIALIVGIGVGWLIAPRFVAPHDHGEARLRERAGDYYRASRRLDMPELVRYFSPARQRAEAAKLSANAAKATPPQKLPEKQRRELEESATGVDPAKLELRIDGDWAVTRGKAPLPLGDGRSLNVDLEPLVWVLDGGEWWIYTFKASELNTYGHPPDFALPLRPHPAKRDPFTQDG
jgi:hypothetical protein